MAAIAKLKEQGWYLSEDGLRKLSEDGKIVDTKELTKKALETDLKEISKGWLAADYNKHAKLDTPSTGVIMQVVEMRNISAPKCNEESKAAPRLLQIDLTDGQTHIRGVEIERIPSLDTHIGPGTKVLLKGNIELILNMMLLTPQNISLMGGRVSSLYDKWEEQKIYKKYASGIKPNTGPNGPPPWVPFGEKIQTVQADRSFKSLNGQKSRELTKEDMKFLATRDELIADAVKLNKQKKEFGGGSRHLMDHNVKRIMDKGYTEEQAKTSLKYTGNNVEKAMGNLKRRDEKTNPGLSTNANSQKGNRMDRFDRSDRPARRGKMDIPEPSKPSGKVSLFDYLEDKIPNVRRSAPPPQDYTVNQNYSNFTPPNTVSSDTNRSSKVNSNYASKYDENSRKNVTKTESVGRAVPKVSSTIGTVQSQLCLENQSASTSADQRSKFENNISTSFANRQKKDDEPPRHMTKHNLANKSNGPPGDGSSSHEPHNRNQSNDYRYRNQSIPSTSRSGGPQSSYGSDGYQKSMAKERTGNGNISSRNSQRYDESKTQICHPSSNAHEKRSSKLFNQPINTNQLADLTSSLKLSNKPNNRYQSSAPPPPPSTHSQQQPQTYQQSQPSQQHHPSKASKTSYDKVFPQIPNGFEFNPYKIVGFQNKEINEFAMNVLKTQSFDGIAQYTQPPPTIAPPPQSQQQTPLPISQPASVTTTPIASSQSIHPPAPTSLHDKFVPMQSFNTPPPPLPKHQQQQQQQQQQQFMSNTNIQPYNWNWNVNDICLAKYWEDGQFYNAEITSVTDKTCVVKYLDYGNFEEVLHTDCLPITDANINQFNGSLTHSNINYQQASSHHHHQQSHHQQQQQHQQQRFRGDRQMYVPPAQRSSK